MVRRRTGTVRCRADTLRRSAVNLRRRSLMPRRRAVPENSPFRSAPEPLTPDDRQHFTAAFKTRPKAVLSLRKLKHGREKSLARWRN
jgi:hypothetical protein